ncbi:hypothetical protein [Kocuria subflava]|uniref:hypothetical protein n=1 Tax=Kocuria subflava TaxID=1736139 RepID=UPI003CC91791
MPGGCSAVFTTVNREADSAASDGKSAERSLESMRDAAVHSKLRGVLDTLIDETVVPSMQGIVGRMYSAAYHGNEALGHMVHGDEIMAEQATISSRGINYPDMPGNGW